MSVPAKWHAAVVVWLLQEEPEPVEWKELHIGSGEGDQLRAYPGVIDKRTAEALGMARGSSGRLGSRVFFKCQTAFVASFDVRTALTWPHRVRCQGH